jgi:nucleotide-binding universal stress UspA family protein
MYQRLLLATDHSSLSRKAEKSAIALAAATGASLVVLHVVPDYPISYFEGAATLSPDEIARIEAAWMRRGQRVIDDVVAAAAKQEVVAEGVLAHADHVAQAVIAAARKKKCDLIVMASHGRRGLTRVLLGSETQHVLTHSTIPVLVLR